MADANMTTAANLESARRRGRWLLARGESFSQSYEVLHAATAARDGAILILALWAMLIGAGHADLLSPLLVTSALVIGTYGGIANALVVNAQLRHAGAQLESLRHQLQTDPNPSREELRAVYEAKGFSGERLEAIVETLSSDEDRLLRVMMKEKMGIFFEQWNHPAIIGLVTGSATVIGGMAVALAATSRFAWLPIAATALVLAAAAMARTGGAHSTTVESFARWAVVAGAAAGIAFHLSRLLIA